MTARAMTRPMATRRRGIVPRVCGSLFAFGCTLLAIVASASLWVLVDVILGALR
jgi:hypothetical protein